MSESACGPEDHQTAVTGEASIRVSVILCVNNAQDTVEEQLQALAVQDFDQPWELVVVDNRCSDETIAIVRRQADRIPRLRVVPASARAGLAYARNVGARAAAGEFLAFCDGDDAVRPQWLRALVETCPDMRMVGGALALDRYNDQTSQFWRVPVQLFAAFRLGMPTWLTPSGRTSVSIGRLSWPWEAATSASCAPPTM